MIDFKPAQIEEDTHTDLMKALSNALEEINLVDKHFFLRDLEVDLFFVYKKT